MTKVPSAPIDPVELTKNLIRCPSVTPNEGGAIELLHEILTELGFECTVIKRGLVTNLFARWGEKTSPTLGFNGHTDVVPVGDTSSWTHDPFGAVEHDGLLYGRGATDMKSGVAAWVAAAAKFVSSEPKNASLAITITGDEEGPAIDGTTAILDWMQENGETMDACIVGEPTCPSKFGEMIKIGRRGSLTAYLDATGKQGHAAYPHRAANPVPVLANLVTILSSTALDQGTAHFDPSTVAVTTFDTGNPASNVIPQSCAATVNIRFNDAHNAEGIADWIEKQARQVSENTGVEISSKVKVSGDSFMTPPGTLSELVSNAVHRETAVRPVLSTSGGTSDARFIKNHCPVVEFGLVGTSMHQVDENVDINQIQQLSNVYHTIMNDFFDA